MPTSKTYPFELIKNPSFPLYVIKSNNICLVPRHRKREGAASLAKLPSCVSPTTERTMFILLNNYNFYK